MANFWALVGNENLKLRRRKLIWIALILVLVISLGFSALVGLLIRAINDFDTDYGTPFSQICEEQIAHCNEMLETETDEGIRQSLKEEILYYQTLLDCGVDRNDWRYTTDLANQYAQAKMGGNDALATRLERMLYAKDYVDYYRYQMELNEAFYANRIFVEAANAGYQFCIDNNIEPSDKDWRYRVAMEMGEALLNLRRVEAYAAEDPVSARKMLETAKNRYALIQYRLENNIRVNPGDSFSLLSTLLNLDSGTTETSRLWDTLNTTLSMTSIVQIFSIILAAGMVASEFGKGTIKFLLITPASRWKILLAKYCSLLINMGILFLAMLLGNILFGVLFCGGGDFFLPILSATGGEIKRSSPILLLIGNYLLESVGMLVMVTLAFMISSLFRHSGVAVGISLLILYGGNTVNTILALVGADWGRYLIFANLNLSNILRGASVFPHQSVVTAIIILILHMAVFLFTAFDAFDRKEI